MRIGAVALCIAFALALCGCAQEAGAADPVIAHEGVRQRVGADAGTHGMNVGDACEMVALAAANDWYWYMQDDKLLSVSSPVLMLASESDREAYPQAADALKRISAEKKDEAKSLFEELKETLSYPYVEELYSETGFTAYRSDRYFLSVLLRTEAYLGGAHPSREYRAVNLNMQTGERLDMTAVVTDPDAVLRLAAEDLRHGYPDVEFLEAPENALPEAYRDGWLCWTLGYDGLSIHIAGGYFSTYADGDLTAFVPFAGNEALFVPAALSVPGSYARAFDYGTRIPDRVTGECGELTVDGISEDPEYGMYDYVTVEWRGTRTSIEQYCYSIRPYYLHTEAGDYLYIETVSEDDYRTLLVYDLAVGRFVGEPMFDTGFSGMWTEEDLYASPIAFDPSAFVLSTGLDALSTYGGIKNYTVGEDGLPVTGDDLYTIVGEFVLTVIRSVPAKDAAGNAILLPVGTELRLTGTDGRTVVYAETSGGTVCLEGQFESYPQTIDGMPIEECFDGLMFAG